MNGKILWLAALIVLVVFVVRAATPPVSDTEKIAAKEKIRKGARVVDVRTPTEYAAGHYTGATNIPLQELQKRLNDVGPTNQSVVVYCRTGTRSARAKQILLNAGFSDVTNAGGLSDLQK
ncbi:MAG: rhodanese-like domain-containing protein [Verrucomicrobiia bacterium]